MACVFSQNEVPERKMRRRKTARERREQKSRALARAFQSVATALHCVASHRGGRLQRIGEQWYGHVLSPDPSALPWPRFCGSHLDTDLSKRAHCNVALQSSQSEDASSQASGDQGIFQLQPLQEPVSDISDDEQLGSQEDDQQGEESVSRSSSISEGAHCNVALSHESGCDASDSDSEESGEVERQIVEGNPEEQYLFRTIYLSDSTHPDDEVGSNDLCCKFSAGDLVRPRSCLAELETYECGAVAQVVSIDEEGLRDLFVSYFDDKGNLKEERKLHFSEHFEKIGTTSVFELLPQIPRSTLLQDRGALLKTCAEIFSNINSA